MVTDVVLIIPHFPYDARDRFNALTTAHLGHPIEPHEESGKSSGQLVYHLGANYMQAEFRDALIAGPWPDGSVLFMHHENDDRPLIKVFGKEPDDGWASEPDPLV